MSIDKYIQILKQQGYKTTPQRKAILNVLLNLEGHLLSIETIFSNVAKFHPNTNLSTIYRNLEIFESVDIVHKIISDDGIALYDIVSDDSHHHHIICKKCGKTESIDYCPINEMIQISKLKKFTLTDHKLELYGYCADCNPNR